MFTDVALSEAGQLTNEEKQILIGICKNRSLNGEHPITITSAFLKQLNNQEIPYAFEERAKHLLQYLYDNGGKQYQGHNMDSYNDSSITYSSSDEFERIIKYLKSEGWIDVDKETMAQQSVSYIGLRITKTGISEIEKGLPKIPMFGLVNQKIITGDIEIDGKIEHARLLFFGEHSTLDSKRSACEALSFVLEPLRDRIKILFEGDTEYFFRIVNEFNVRHNKERTKVLQYEEQLEWIFYSLLNTISTYSKMKRRKA